MKKYFKQLANCTWVA